MPYEVGDGCIPAAQLRLGKERFPQVLLDVRMQNDRADTQDQRVERGPIGIEVGVDLVPSGELVALGRADGQKSGEDGRPQRAAFDKRATDIGHHVGSFEHKCCQSAPGRVEPVGRGVRQRCGFQSLAYHLQDVLIDRGGQRGLGTKVVLHQPNRNIRGLRDRAQRRGGDAANSKAAQRGVANSLLGGRLCWRGRVIRKQPGGCHGRRIYPHLVAIRRYRITVFAYRFRR